MRTQHLPLVMILRVIQHQLPEFGTRVLDVINPLTLHGSLAVVFVQPQRKRSDTLAEEKKFRAGDVA